MNLPGSSLSTGRLPRIRSVTKTRFPCWLWWARWEPQNSHSAYHRELRSSSRATEPSRDDNSDGPRQVRGSIQRDCRHRRGGSDKPRVWIRLDSGMVQQAADSRQAGADRMGRTARSRGRSSSAHRQVGACTQSGRSQFDSRGTVACSVRSTLFHASSQKCCLSLAILAQGVLHRAKTVSPADCRP